MDELRSIKVTLLPQPMGREKEAGGGASVRLESGNPSRS